MPYVFSCSYASNAQIQVRKWSMTAYIPSTHCRMYKYFFFISKHKIFYWFIVGHTLSDPFLFLKKQINFLFSSILIWPFNEKSAFLIPGKRPIVEYQDSVHRFSLVKLNVRHRSSRNYYLVGRYIYEQNAK